jgi:hypothetical protein
MGIIVSDCPFEVRAMLRVRNCLIPLLLATPVVDAQDTKEEVLTKPFEDRRDLTLLRRVTERTFFHEAARVAFTVPEGWKEIRPHRLARKIDQRISTVLGIERADRDLVVSLYWIPMNPRETLSFWVRDTESGGEYGEEYETLKAVYGKDRVTTPTIVKHGPFDVYRINITGGPDRGEKYDGMLLVFEVEAGGTHWLVKARVSFPKGDKIRTDQYANEVLDGFTRVPDTAAPAPKKAADVDSPVPDKK